VARALHRPNIMTRDSKRPKGILKAILYSSPLCIRILLYPHCTLSLVKKCAPKSLSTSLGIKGIGAVFFLVTAFSGL